MLSIINITTYRFVRLPNNILPKLQISLKSKATELGLKGTVLLSVEGINLFISGESDAINSFQNFLNTYSYFQKQLYGYVSKMYRAVAVVEMKMRDMYYR